MEFAERTKKERKKQENDTKRTHFTQNDNDDDGFDKLWCKGMS